ncbi:MAG: c-type cytochrome [Planctomycetia bacterium]|nr:c-type cytochrome [Planctomycetia bacterium]
MRAQTRVSRKIFGAAIVAVFLSGVILMHEPSAVADPPAMKPASVAEIAAGRELFLREWIANDPRSHGGDGLGPVFNDTSCVACHNQGGAGGGGPASKNVDVVSAVAIEDAIAADTDIDFVDLGKKVDSAPRETAATLASLSRGITWVRLLMGAPVVSMPVEVRKTEKIDVAELAKFHPGFRTSRSIVLPRSGTESEFRTWHPISAQSARIGNLTRSDAVPQPNGSEDLSVPYEVWRRGDHETAIWLFVETIKNRMDNLINTLMLPVMFSARFEPGLSTEAAATRDLRLQFSFTRTQLLNMVINEASVQFDDRGQRLGNAAVVASERNPTSLFGAGLIDSIPDTVIEQAAKVRHREFLFVRGRVSRLREGRIGKFGWKGQTASLRDFTLTACAVELGLNVPGHEQAVVPYKPDYRSPGFDMNERECNALIAFLASLRAPARTKPASTAHAEYLNAGEKLFGETGCAACHMPKLGDIAGIYSDLLLHDMGPALSDSGVYGSALPDTPDEDDVDAESQVVASGDSKGEGATTQGQAAKKTRFRGPRRAEWRTPPLWGVRDSGPYLHDGRAETIPDAVAMHGGEALASTNRFFKLPHEQRQQLVSFLKSLTAPVPD